MPNTPPSSHPPNANTILRLPALGSSEAKIQRAWDMAREALPRALPALGPGYSLFWTDGVEIDFRHLEATPLEYRVIGRHTACDVVLSSDPTISLRHLLARAVVLEDGTTALRLFDLMTTVPFNLEDGTPRRSIVASGPLLIQLGDYVIGGIPTDPAEHDAAMHGPYRRPAPPVVVEALSPPSVAGRVPGRATLITALPAPPSIETLPPAALEGGPAQQRITMSREYDAVTIALDDQQLESGLLIGRAPKCEDRGLRTVLSLSVSRVHLLLLRDRGATVAYDLCSTQGTFHDGRRVRRLMLPSSGTMLTLGSHQTVDLWWHPREP
jgi:hypothetical protein